MNLRIAERYQIVKQEVTTHWKTGVAITTVAIVVHRVYGKTAMLGIVLLTISSYQVIGQYMQATTWSRIRITLIATVIFSCNYYEVIPAKILCNIAVSLVLIDNYKLVGVNVDLAAQIEILKELISKLQKTSVELKNMEQELQRLVGPAAHLQSAHDENRDKIKTVKGMIPEEVQEMPDRLHNLAVLMKQLEENSAMKEMLDYQDKLKSKISALVDTFSGICKELLPATEKVERLSESLTDTTGELKANVVQMKRQIEALQEEAAKLRRIL